MKILLCYATEQEVQPMLAQLNLRIGTNFINQHEIYLLETGVGMVATAWALGRHLAINHYDLAINAGIAGAFSKKEPLGVVYNVQSDCFAELGAEDGTEFLPISSLGFGIETETAIPSTAISLPICHLPKATAVTVNRVHGHEPSIEALKSRMNVDLESMEGAAFFYACRMTKLPSIQLRAVSNWVERRNRAAWDIKSAVINLNKELSTLLQLLLH